MNTILIREAQLLTTGAEIHTTNELIAMYRGAVVDAHVVAVKFEKALQDHVISLRAKRFRTRRGA
jgi:hypothetical protein